MEPILECKNLKKLYTAHTGLQDVNLTLERGKIIGLLGPNGAGKTTLLNILSSFIGDEERIITGEGFPVHKFPSQKGDLHLKFNVILPKSLNKKEKDLIREIFASWFF